MEVLQGWVIEDVIPAEQRQMLFWLAVGRRRDANDFLPQAPRRNTERNTNDYLWSLAGPADSLLNLTAE